MPATFCELWTDLDGPARRIGHIVHEGAPGEFNYRNAHVDAGGPSIDPINLPLEPGRVFSTHANHGLFGVLHDAGPDTWGRKVLTSIDPAWMGRATELDVLLRTSGHGVGALLFSESLDDAPRRSRGVALDQLGAAAEAAHQVEQGELLRAQLRALMMASTSMGGLHPKIAVTDTEGVDWIAKFKARDDEIDTPRIELAMMQLAGSGIGITAAAVRQVGIGEQAALLVRRFDRTPDSVLHYASAHGLWNAERMSEAHVLGWASYAGIGELRRKLPGGDVAGDVAELFRRMVLNIVIGNTDDHGRNHGFLMDRAGNWRLAPAFDVLPSFRSERQALGVGPDGTRRSLENALAGAALFGLNQVQAREAIVRIQRAAKRRLPGLLRTAGAAPAETERVLARVLVMP